MHPSAATERPLDYSKWDHIGSSSDEEEEQKRAHGAALGSSDGKKKGQSSAAGDGRSHPPGAVEEPRRVIAPLKSLESNSSSEGESASEGGKAHVIDTLKWEFTGEAGGAGRSQSRRARGEVGVVAHEGSEKFQMNRAEMVHYLDVSGGWTLDSVCECCFNRAVGVRRQDAFIIMNLPAFHDFMKSEQPDSIPHAPRDRQTRAILTYSMKVPAVRSDGQLVVPPRNQFEWKSAMAPYLCAQAMFLDWMAEPRVGVLMDLGTIRSRLPALLADIDSAPAPTAASSVTARESVGGLPPASSAVWSCCWRCSSCWAAYRRAVSFAAYLVLVARCPRIVTLWRAAIASPSVADPAIVTALGAGSQAERDCVASLWVQILGVKEPAELKEGFGCYMQNLLSGGLEKVHAEGQRSEGRKSVEGGGADLLLGDGEVAGERGSGIVEVAGSAECGGRGSKGGEDGKDRKSGQWREHLKGPVWERYVDGMGWLLTHGGGEGRAFGCSHCSEDSNTGDSGSSSRSSSLGSISCATSSSTANTTAVTNDSNTSSAISVPKGMHVSGVGATEFALTVATVLSQPENWKEGLMYFLDGNNANKTRVEDAAIEEARARLRREMNEGGRGGRGGEGGEGGGGTGGGGGGGGRGGGEVLPPSVGAVASNGASLDKNSSRSTSATTPSHSSVASAPTGLVAVNTNPVIAVTTYRVGCILQWIRVYGSDFISEEQCGKDSAQGRVLPMRHPLRDLPSLLLRLGAVPKPLDDTKFPLEWEEFPEGDEAAMKFPDDPSARCFGLGIVEEREAGEAGGVRPPRTRTGGRGGGRNRRGGGLIVRDGIPAQVSSPLDQKLPIVRCMADIDFIVDYAGDLLPRPQCAMCKLCFASFNHYLPFLALIATFAYRPASVLFDRFLSVFPPHSPEFKSLANTLFSQQHAPAGMSLRGKLRLMRVRADEYPLLFLITVALKWPKPILDIKELLSMNVAMGQEVAPEEASEGKQTEKQAGGGREGDDLEVCEEVRWWCHSVLTAQRSSLRRLGAALKHGRKGSMKSYTEQGRVEFTKEHAAKLWSQAAMARFREDVRYSSSNSGSYVRGKKGEVPVYLKPWPGGVNLVACLREMLLGQPCYLPPFPTASSLHTASSSVATATSPAASSTPAVPSSHAVPTTTAALVTAEPKHAYSSTGAVVSDVDTHAAAPNRLRVCSAVGCAKAEGVGVKLRSCSGCGKAAYCGRDCQKAHWPSHKLACRGKASSKVSGKEEGQPA